MYTPELANKICAEIATSTKSLRTICSADGMPNASTVLFWLADATKPEFLEQYTRAKEEQADFMCEEMIEIADDGSNDFMEIQRGDESYTVENKEWTSRSKLRVETRKWLASKLKPKKYGDKIQSQQVDKNGDPTDWTVTLNLNK